jgi:hypothetical protein
MLWRAISARPHRLGSTGPDSAGFTAAAAAAAAVAAGFLTVGAGIPRKVFSNAARASAERRFSR